MCENLEHRFSDRRFRIFGGLFLLSTRLETIGNSSAYLGPLTTKQWFLLLNLFAFFESPPAIGQLAEQMGTSHQNTKMIAENLRKKGYLDLIRDEKDGRAIRVVPLEKSKSFLQDPDRRELSFVRDLMAELRPEELELFEDCLFRLIHRAEALYKHDSLKEEKEKTKDENTGPV